MKELDLFYQCHVTGQESSIWQLQCRLRIIQQFGRQIAIVSPQNCEIGWFIPAQTAKLATQIVQEFELNPDRLTWIEHDSNYSSLKAGSEYSEVKFQWHQGIATDPKWRSISDSTKLLIGEPLFEVKMICISLADRLANYHRLNRDRVSL